MGRKKAEPDPVRTGAEELRGRLDTDLTNEYLRYLAQQYGERYLAQVERELLRDYVPTSIFPEIINRHGTL